MSITSCDACWGCWILGIWLVDYNERCPHQTRLCCGKTRRVRWSRALRKVRTGIQTFGGAQVDVGKHGSPRYAKVRSAARRFTPLRFVSRRFAEPRPVLSRSPQFKLVGVVAVIEACLYAVPSRYKCLQAWDLPPDGGMAPCRMGLTMLKLPVIIDAGKGVHRRGPNPQRPMRWGDGRGVDVISALKSARQLVPILEHGTPPR